MTRICVYAPEVCVRRSLDSKKIFNYLSENKYEIVYDLDNADVIIFVTCAVGDRNTGFSLDMVRELQKYDAELIVAGCLPVIEKEELAKIFDGRTINTKDLDSIGQLFQGNLIEFNALDDANILYETDEEETHIDPIKKLFGGVKSTEWITSRYFEIRNYILKDQLGEQSAMYRLIVKKQFYIRVSWGCRGNCSYCGIKKAVGPLKSKPLDKCITEFKNGLNAGYKHFSLTADDIGAYGLDDGSSFPELLDEITKIPGDYEIAILEIAPRWIVKYIDDLEEILKRGKVTMINIPFQSGCSRILKLMNRYSDAEKMKDAILKLRRFHPGLSLATQSIVGFPTETDEEFRQTIHFIKDVNFNGGHLYQFSCKTGTKAESIEPKISKEEMIERLKYAKKYLRNIGCSVFYRSILYSPKFYHCLGFVKR